MAKLIHVHIGSKNPDSVIKFYQSVFGMDAGQLTEQNIDMAYTTLKHPANADGPDIGVMPAGKSHFNLTFQVADLNGAIAKVKSAGGKVLTTQKPHDTFHDYALCQDVEGNVFTLVG